MLLRSRTLTLMLAGPLSLFAYHPLHAVASTGGHSCDGLTATTVVTSSSPHIVRGTDHRDVIGNPRVTTVPRALRSGEK